MRPQETNPPIPADSAFLSQPEDVREFQSRLRRRMTEARLAIPPAERAALSRRIAAAIMASAPFRRAETVMIYRAVPGEVQLDGLTGKRLCWPRCGPGGTMQALAPRPGALWERGAFGIYEPPAEASDVIAPEDIDLVICPCTSFDSACVRLGMGGGYYDRFLPGCKNAFVAAVAFEAQRADSIPAQPWDWPMDAIFTEKTVYHSYRDPAHGPDTDHQGRIK